MKQSQTQHPKVALITGAARRIGAAIAQTLHAAHYNVIIHCRQSVGTAERLAAELNQKRAASATVISLDLMADHAAATLIAESLDWQGRLDVLVNNASNFLSDPSEAYDPKHWTESFKLNAEVPFALSLAAETALKKTEGCIINISDIHAEKPLKNYAVYCQSKAALSMQTKALARRLAPLIRVNAVAPGAIIWPEGDNHLNAEQKAAILDKTLLKKQGHPDNIAKAVLSLIENRYITGQILAVDGGRSLL